MIDSGKLVRRAVTWPLRAAITITIVSALSVFVAEWILGV